MSVPNRLFEYWTNSELVSSLKFLSWERASASVSGVYVWVSCRCSVRDIVMYVLLSRMAGPRFLSHIRITKSLLLRKTFKWFCWILVKLVAGFEYWICRLCKYWRLEINEFNLSSKSSDPGSGNHLDFIYNLLLKCSSFLSSLGDSPAKINLRLISLVRRV